MLILSILLILCNSNIEFPKQLDNLQPESISLHYMKYNPINKSPDIKTTKKVYMPDKPPFPFLEFSTFFKTNIFAFEKNGIPTTTTIKKKNIPHINSTLKSLNTIIRVIPHDTLLYSICEHTAKHSYNFDKLKARLVFHISQITDETYYDITDPNTPEGSVMYGCLIHNGEKLQFVSFEGSRTRDVHFCPDCGFYVFRMSGLRYLNVEVDHIVYLYLVTFLFAENGMLSKEVWPVIACKTSCVQYLIRGKNVRKSWCMMKHPLKNTYNFVVHDCVVTSMMYVFNTCGKVGRRIGTWCYNWKFF